MSDGVSSSEVVKQENYWRMAGKVCDGGLFSAVARSGGELLGLSVKYGEFDCLVTLRAILPSGRMIAFVGGDTLASTLIKAYREANSDSLTWKVDKYARGQVDENKSI